MSDEEVEAFEITDHDLDTEFNPMRSRRRPTKHQQIYGVWADDGSSGEEDDGKKSSFKNSRKPKNYSAPIGFVAGGVQQAGKKKEAKVENDEEDDDMDGQPGPSRRRTNISSSESEDEKPSFGRSQKGFDMGGDIAGLRKHRAPQDTSLMQKGVGGWEKHTKGIGAKLLLQMGYEPGKGLGKDLQGINAPVVAKLRKGRGAIGAYGKEESAKIAELKIDDKKSKQDLKVTEKLSRWRKDDATANQRVRYVYKTIEEVIEQGQGQSGAPPPDSALSKVKVIDMTGREQRVLSGYHAISRQQRPASEWESRKELKTSNFALPELQHNLNLLVDLCEQDIISNDRKYKYATDRITALQYENSQLQTTVQKEEEAIEKLEAIIKNIDDLMIVSDSGARMQLDQLGKACSAFTQMKKSNPVEFEQYDLAEMVTSLVAPVIKTSLSSWQPMDSPDEPYALLMEWRRLLENERTVLRSTLASPEPWGKLLWHAWLPSLRFASTNWNSRQPEPMLRLIEVWRKVIPPWLINFVLESLVLPRLTIHVSDWDPLTDTVPIHSWIHPWLPHLNAHLSTVVFPMIRQALAHALTAWHPSDRSAKLMIQPWIGVFTRGEMNAFLIKNILPKLNQTMDELVINPQNQNLDDHWKWVMDWMDLMPASSMGSLLSKHFFPKWLQVLSIWLNHCPNFDQVSTWYLGWKAQIPEALLKQTDIKEYLRQALDLMNRSASAAGAPGALESVSYLKTLDREAGKSTPSAAAHSRLQSMTEAVRMGAQSAVSGFKQLFAKRCEEKDIVFVPLGSKTYEGKQVYRCGTIQVYMDRNVLFVSTNNGATWQPQSVSTALMMAEK